MEDQSMARMGSLLAIGGRERVAPPPPSEFSNIDRSQVTSAMEDSRRAETLRKSAVAAMAKTCTTAAEL
ncbi:hypothetical protein Vadar_032801 [Vaccinium darrowii]|uniref:Uncharacterized protein n=1 Tax=Vaccinium darrowii TaxID=229202 RepID=A0ACB7ZN33_9ERIC|nr:hypothetical protein Vadar_032801 [Vaccinium darrowii]